MLFSARVLHPARPTPAPGPATPGARIYRPAEPPAADVDEQDTRIWSWRLGANPAQIVDVDCLVTNMHNMHMRVCDKIEFGDIRVKISDTQQVTLTLSNDFLVRRYYIYDGLIAEDSSALFPLTSRVDTSLLHVFAFEIPIGTTSIMKPDEAVLSHPAFMPPVSDRSQTAVVRGGERRRIVVSPLRFVVLASLVCGKGRADFEPGEVLLAGRLTPHVMTMCNKSVKEIAGSVTIERPATTSHAMAGMNAGIEASLYRDNNERVGPPLSSMPWPHWGTLFDDYIVGWDTTAFDCVRPEKAACTIADAVQVTDCKQRYPTNVPSLSVPTPRTQPLSICYFDSELRDVSHVARQGAFDNIHLAPTHTNRPGPTDAFTGLDKIYMAPICEHDCLHTHWRWGAYNSDRPQKGWQSPPRTGPRQQEIVCPVAPTGCPARPWCLTTKRYGSNRSA